MEFSYAPNGILKLGDCGHFMDSKSFCYKGNLFDDLESCSLKVNITPKPHKISSGHQQESDVVRAYDQHWNSIDLY
ncbi:hypothetical protein SCLCIDRAFT_29589 [Scleroderma citrinum Foug A]|uniref:Uncharacterized protein n=1 Tax=Scleroderma citrinum Foug A TaxID=1036808 RepID=A0A0C3DJD2_9AGAM|nr:hypothetical protein SCLCIDRAFT_29589 [Scleroderma citrinum Foug A]